MPVRSTLMPVVDPGAIQVSKDKVQGSIESNNSHSNYRSLTLLQAKCQLKASPQPMRQSWHPSLWVGLVLVLHCLWSRTDDCMPGFAPPPRMYLAGAHVLKHVAAPRLEHCCNVMLGLSLSVQSFPHTHPGPVLPSDLVWAMFCPTSLL